jgi:membrane-associated phospholipid phosphatase
MLRTRQRRNEDEVVNGRRVGWLMFVMCLATSALHAQTAGGQSARATEPAAASLLMIDQPVAASALSLSEVLQQPAGPAPTPAHTGIKALLKDLGRDVTHLPSRENLIWVGVGAGLAAAAHPADGSVNRYLVGNSTADKIFKAGAVMGELGTLMGTAATVYAVGRITDTPKVSHVGMDLIQALALSEGLTQTLKYTTRRERPDHSSRNSFPSGHAADTFAFATAMERHLGWRGAAPAYALASYVAISRMPANRHWLSDAVFGAAVGVIAGRTVTSQETMKYPVSLSIVPGGAAVVFVRREAAR